MTVEEKIEAFAPQWEKIPGVTVILEMDGFKPVFMTSNGLKLLKMSMKELIATGENYKHLFFNEDFMPDYLEQLTDMMKKDDSEEAYSFLHQVEIEGKFQWYFASIKVFHRTKSGPTHTITSALPVNDIERATSKAERLLAEQKFSCQNMLKFESLSKRELEVLERVALGKSSSEIAEELSISTNTVNSHRKTLKQKLNISSNYEFSEYALSFDLI